MTALPRLVEDLLADWDLVAEPGPARHGYCSLVVPVRTGGGQPAMLKVAFPPATSGHEHLALRHWNGRGAVALLRADPHRAALLLDRLGPADLDGHPDLAACRIVGQLYGRLHRPAPPTIPLLPELIAANTERLREHGSALPRRLVEQAIALGADLASDPASSGTLIHTDLHYANVLAAGTTGRRDSWLAIDPRPLSGDPHYEPAPMLFNRWAEVAGQARTVVRRRLDTLVSAAGLDPDRARAWVIVRMVHLTLQVGTPADWLTTCVVVSKAVQD